MTENDFSPLLARDSKGSLNGKFSTVSLNVYLTNVNDNPPVVGDYEREIIENEREFDPELKVQVNFLENIHYNIFRVRDLGWGGVGVWAISPCPWSNASYKTETRNTCPLILKSLNPSMGL
jgi:hypothetical protein